MEGPPVFGTGMELNVLLRSCTRSSQIRRVSQMLLRVEGFYVRFFCGNGEVDLQEHSEVSPR